MPLGAPDFRVIRTEPIVFSPFDPHLMFFAANTLWKTRDGGHQLEADQSRPDPQDVGGAGIGRSLQVQIRPPQPKQRGVIYAVAPSPIDVNRIWAGTDDGLIWLTTDGGAHWNNITPPQLFGMAEGLGHGGQPLRSADGLRGDQHAAARRSAPHIYRTHDSGKTWTEITNGIAANQNVNSVREDPKRKGLLFAGTERAVYVSFDDGDHWQSLRLNMPATSVRDLLIKDDDLAIATHGRGFWILDDITPLRQLERKSSRRSAPTCLLPNSRIACAGTRTPTRRCRRTSRPDRIRRMAQSSTIT